MKDDTVQPAVKQSGFEQIMKDIEDNIEKPLISATFGDKWKENALQNYPLEVAVNIALKQGRRAILLERALYLLSLPMKQTATPEPAIKESITIEQIIDEIKPDTNAKVYSYNQVKDALWRLVQPAVKEGDTDAICEKIVKGIGDYVNGLDRRNLGVPLMDEVAVMQMEVIVHQCLSNPDKEIEMPEYD